MTGSSSEPERENHPGWWSSRLGLPNLVRHLERFPLPADRASWVRAFGGALVVILLLETCTGLLLALYYRPDMTQAHASVAHIVDDVRYGWLLRSLHATGAHAVVMLGILHAITTFLDRSFRAPRELTWWTGMLLALVIVAFAYTGEVLPWDRTGLYAAQVGTSLAEAVPWIGPSLGALLRGDSVLAPSTLQRAYTLHVGILPAIVVTAGTLHVYLVHTHGLSGTERAETRPPGMTLRTFLPRACLFWLLLVNVVVVVSALSPAPLEPAADLNTPSAGAQRPVWYFMALFHLVRSTILGGNPRVVLLMLFTLGAMLAAAPLGGRAPRGWGGPTIVRIVGGALVLLFLVLTLVGYGG